jgi:signal transduction histidine kinase
MNCYGLIHEYILSEYILSILNLGLLLILQTFFLIRYIRNKNLELIEYFDLIKNKETGFQLSDSEKRNSFSKVKKKFNETNKIIQDIRIEKEIQSNYLNHLISYIKIGLLSFDEDEKIQFVNPEAKRILELNHIFKLNDLNQLNPNFSDALKKIQPTQSEIIEISNSSVAQKLSITAALFNLNGSKVKLISFQDIDHHLYRNELESWNKLIRILNHEIMNSITPITSLTKTLKKYFLDGKIIKKPESITVNNINRTVEGLNIIEERGAGLLNFVSNYRKLSSLPEPSKTNLKVELLILQIKNLFSDEMLSKSIDLKIEIEPSNLVLYADKDLISQVLINLIRNSIESIETTNGEVTIKAKQNENKVLIQIIDNGSGIPPEVLQNVFIPFYTTKDSGSGIGLSLSKQIMQLHNGTISAASIPNEKTEFKLNFTID